MLERLIPKAASPSVQYQWGVVATLSPLKVLLDGPDTTPVPVASSLCPVQTGMRVYTSISEGQLTILGTVVAATWTNLPLSNSWVAYGGIYVAPQYRADGATVQLRGLAKSGGTGLLGTLPAALAPEYPVISVVLASNGTARVDVTTAGLVNVFAYYGGSNNGYLSLDNITWTIKPQ